MAEQLSDLSYKPWMKGNFNRLQLQSVDVATASQLVRPYFSPNILTSAYLNPPYSVYTLTYTPLHQKDFTVDVLDNEKIVCGSTGLYNIFLILNQEISSGGSGRWDYNVNIENTTSLQTITSKFVGGDPYDRGLIKTTFNCAMEMTVGDVIKITLQQNVGSSDVNAIVVQGSDSVNKPSLLITKLDN